MADAQRGNPYQKAVQDYVNSISVQNSLANYHLAMQSAEQNYKQIQQLKKELNGAESIKPELQAEQNVKIAIGELKVLKEVEDTDAVKEKAERALLEAQLIEQQDIAKKRLIQFRLNQLERRDAQRQQNQVELDTKSKIIYINENAAYQKGITLKKLSTTLFFLVLIAFLSYGSFMGMISASAFNWMIGVAVLSYLATMYWYFWWKPVYRFEYNVMSYLFPRFTNQVMTSSRKV